MFGFVYIWRDKKRKKFCIGSHYGRLDDGYVTSTGHMPQAYKKRPEDFKRRILWVLLIPDHKFLLAQEQRVLNMIKDHELGTKYYNYKKHAAGGNGHANRGKNKHAWNRGITREMLQLRRQALFCLLIDRPQPKTPWTHTEDFRAQMSIKMKQRWVDGKLKPWNKGMGRPHQKPMLKRTAWNKGLPNPQAVLNGKRSVAKQSKTVTGRRKYVLSSNLWQWKYFDDTVQLWYLKTNEGRCYLPSL